MAVINIHFAVDLSVWPSLGMSQSDAKPTSFGSIFRRLLALIHMTPSFLALNVSGCF